jgi:hypothetical protein
MTLKVLLATFILLSVGCASPNSKKVFDMTFEIMPEQSLVVLDQFTVKHDGYGHRITPEGDRSFFSFSVSDKSKPEQQGNFRVSLPVHVSQTYEWRSLQLKVLSCQDKGPPHSKDAKVVFSAKILEKVAAGSKHAMKMGDAIAFENGPTLKLTHFGHDEDDDGGHAIANFTISAENLTQSLVIMSSTTTPMIQTWHDWKIQIHKWNQQGPPPTATQSVEVSVTKK